MTTVAIVGGGIGGMTLALSLLAAGIDDLAIYESSSGIRELGVGINIQPHAIRELTEPGLLDRLYETGIPTAEGLYLSKHGKLVWTEPRGLASGYRWPQFSIHRGHLLGLLHRAVVERLQRRLAEHHRRAHPGPRGGAPAVHRRAVTAYDAARRPVTPGVAMASREIGPERCLEVVEERAPDGFDNLHDIVSQWKLEQISIDFKRAASMDPSIRNERPSLSVR